MKNASYKHRDTLLKRPIKLKNSHLETAKNCITQSTKNNFYGKTRFSLKLVTFLLTAATSSFAMMEDDEQNNISHFVRYLESKNDHWNIDNNKATTHVFPISLPRPTRYSLHLMSSREDLSKIQPGEIGLFSEDGKIYCRISNKQEIEIIKSEDPTIGLSSEIFDRIFNALEEYVDPVYLQAALDQEERRNHAAANRIYNRAFESITALDQEALFKYTLMRGYTPPAYNPTPVPNFILERFFLSEFNYDGVPLFCRWNGERTFYEREINGENISLEVRYGQEGLSHIGDTPETKAIVFGPQSFSLGGNNAHFEVDPMSPTKNFIIQSNNGQGKTLYDYFIRKEQQPWKGCPTLTYEGTLGEGPRLKMTFKGQHNNTDEFHPLSPTTFLYALDAVQPKIGIFVKLNLPHFGFQFWSVKEEKLAFKGESSRFPRQIYYDGNHIYREVSQKTITFQTPSLSWFEEWGPKLINAEAPDLLEKLNILNAHQQSQDDPSNPLETVFVNPECQRPIVGAKRKIPEGRYKFLGRSKKRAKTIYVNGEGKFSIAHEVEEEWEPVDNEKQPCTVKTYFKTGIDWKLFDDVTSYPTSGSFSDKGFWRPGLYRGIEGLQKNNIIWEKMDTSSNEMVTYTMNLGQQVEMGEPLSAEKMPLKDFMGEISYYPMKSLNLLKESNTLDHQSLNNILFQMPELQQLHLKFNFNVKGNSFENFIKILKNESFKNNINNLELRFNKCPPFNKTMSNTLGTCLAEFSHLQQLKIDIPHVRSYMTASARTLITPVMVVGASYDAFRFLKSISYEEYLILARTLAKSPSLQRIEFYGVTRPHDQENIKTEIHKTCSDIMVSFANI